MNNRIRRVFTVLCFGIVLTSSVAMTSPNEKTEQIKETKENIVKVEDVEFDVSFAGVTKTIQDILNDPEPVVVEELENDIVAQPVEEIVEPEPEPKPLYPYTEHELDVFAHLLFAEAGAEYCSDTTIYYVGSVVLNRVDDRRYPNNIMDVIYQKGQYSPTWNGFMNRKPTKRCYRIAKDLLWNGSILPKKVLGQANKTIANRYGVTYKVLDGIYFFYLKGDK